MTLAFIKNECMEAGVMTYLAHCAMIEEWVETAEESNELPIVG